MVSSAVLEDTLMTIQGAPPGEGRRWPCLETPVCEGPTEL